MAVRLQSGLAQPQELFFTVEADERLRSYVAPFLLGQYAYDVGEYAMAQGLLAEASAGAAGDLPRGVEYAHLLEGSAFYMLGNDAAAIASYTAAVAENVGLLSAYSNRALADRHERDRAAAQADVAYVLSKDPLQRDAHVLTRAHFAGGGGGGG